MSAAPSKQAQEALIALVKQQHPGHAVRIVDAHGFTLGRVEIEAYPRWLFVGYCDDLMRRHGIPFSEDEP